MRLLITILVLIYSESLLLADTPKVYFTVRPERGTQSSEFMVQISISGQDFANTGSPVFEETEEMSLSSLSSSIQQQIINGNISFQKTFLLKINFAKVLASGEYFLPRGSITIDGNKYRFPTKKIFIEAESSNQGSGNQPSPNLIPQDNSFQFIQTVSNSKPFIGEQVLYKVEIIAPHNLEKAQLEEFEPQGLWRERYGQDEKKVSTIQNTTVHSFSESWYPIQAGVVEVPERILMAEVKEFQRKQRPNLNLGSSFGDQLLGSLLPYLNQFKSVEKKLVAAPFKIEVRPLPPPPVEIKGFVPVGNLKITSSFESESVKLGEPIILTVQVSGDANLRPLEIADPANLDSRILKRYDEKPILSRTIGESNVIFYKTFKISLIPLKSGFIKVPQFRIDWFNPVTQTYEHYLTQNESINVVGDGTPESEPELEEPLVTEQPKEVSDNQANNTKNDFNIPYLSRTTSLTLGLSMFGLIISILIFQIVKNIRLLAVLSRNLSVKKKKGELKRLIGSNNKENVDLFLEFKRILEYKYSENFLALTPAELARILRNKKLPKLASGVLDLFAALEERKYSGQNDSPLGDKLKPLVRLIDEI